ncbi:MAG: tRNA guanosine(34) transglycosylase Tgt [Minisyncoccia bacterium]
MLDFKIIKKSKKSRARIGILKINNREIETPSFVPVATQAVIKSLKVDDVLSTNTNILIANTFHLHLKPGEKIIKKAGGLHKFMNWNKLIMTDSAGFQVFSLGFGKDFGVGKQLKYFPEKDFELVKSSQQPKEIKITSDGVFFKSLVDGKILFIGPETSIKIQQDLGADIIFAFDECTPPLAHKNYAIEALERTHRWAQICIRTKTSNQALFGIVQGSHFKDLRQYSAKFINDLNFDGFGIGGDLGASKQMMKNILNWTIPYLNENKPRHLLGIGYLEDIEQIIKQGIDLFDCIVPTHYARRGIAFINYKKPERLNLNQTKFLLDKNPIDKTCNCEVCQNYKRNYLTHLLHAKELTAYSLLTIHNLYFFNKFVDNIKQKIKKGII